MVNQILKDWRSDFRKEEDHKVDAKKKNDERVLVARGVKNLIEQRVILIIDNWIYRSEIKRRLSLCVLFWFLFLLGFSLYYSWGTRVVHGETVESRELKREGLLSLFLVYFFYFLQQLELETKWKAILSLSSIAAKVTEKITAQCPLFISYNWKRKTDTRIIFL